MKHPSNKYNFIQPNKSHDKKIPSNEPVFLIRGQDKLGPKMLRIYASDLEMLGGHPSIVADIRAQAYKMEAWQAKTGTCKIAD
ncbi:MAG: hypothetical protein KKD77_21615 [Gammaproteobacteria bacterium]|nr:hypothetical protein [Gammaproteobacteria bacterium]